MTIKLNVMQNLSSRC